MQISSMILSCGAYCLTKRLIWVHVYVPSSRRTRTSLLSFLSHPSFAFFTNSTNLLRSLGWTWLYTCLLYTSQLIITRAFPVCWILRLYYRLISPPRTNWQDTRIYIPSCSMPATTKRECLLYWRTRRGKFLLTLFLMKLAMMHARLCPWVNLPRVTW